MASRLRKGVVASMQEGVPIEKKLPQCALWRAQKSIMGAGVQMWPLRRGVKGVSTGTDTRERPPCDGHKPTQISRGILV